MMPRQGEIWLVPVPFTDLSSSKLRPALVISGDHINRTGWDVVVVAITSNLSTPMPGLDFDNADIEDGAIKQRSRILPTKIYTLHRGILAEYFCRVNPELLQRVFQELDIALGRVSR
jgi:mRNA interferase MazF